MWRIDGEEEFASKLGRSRDSAPKSGSDIRLEREKSAEAIVVKTSIER